MQVDHPTSRPVQLRLESLGREQLGDCTRHGKRLIIRVNPKLTWRIGNDILMHEYAHAMSWPAANMEARVPDHSDEWALAYARLYRFS